jgi:uncharacterized membrane protein
MKRIYQLKTLLDLTLGLSIAVLSLAIFGLVLGAFYPTDLNFSIQGNKVEHVDLSMGILLALSAIGYVIFIYGLLQLKRLTANFVAREFFTTSTVQLAKSTGASLLYSAALLYIPPYFIDMISESKISIKFSSVHPESFLFLIIIGLFFITLSYVFEQAKILKDENEYTV